MRNFAKKFYHALLQNLPTYFAIRLEFLRYFGYLPNLKNPSTFNEKVQYSKLHNRSPLLPLYADKYAVKEVVKKELAENILIPTLWVGSDPHQIPFGKLPIPYVIKGTHGSHMDYFVMSQEDENAEKIITECTLWLKRDFFRKSREWAYKLIEPRILIEPFIGTNGISPQDYRFWCFHGKVQMIQVDTDRRYGVKRAFFNKKWNLLPLKMVNPPLIDFPPPVNLKHMIEISEKLASKFDFVRIDLYEHEKQVFFGEATFYPVGGCALFDPPEVEYDLSRLWKMKIQ